MDKEKQSPLLVLASKSPRRRYLLEQAGLRFDVIPSSVDESRFSMEVPKTYVSRLAEAKAGDVSRSFPDKWVIGADTIVVIDGSILGKPRSIKDAEDMLRRLSGQTHEVFTGFAVCCQRRQRLFSKVVKTEVTFKTLSEDEIQWYIHTPEPFDKAGAYAIQGLGTFLVKRICGSYTNVVGLPVCEVIEFLIGEGLLGFENNDRILQPGSGGNQY